MNHTTNLHLPQWEETDFIQRTDFNAAMAAIDAAMPRIATGTYTGTGEYGEEHPNTLTFDFAPKLVLIRSGRSILDYGLDLFFPSQYGTLEKIGSSLGSWDTIYVTWNQNTVSWYNGSDADSQMNQSDNTYYFIAIK